MPKEKHSHKFYVVCQNTVSVILVSP